MLIENEAAISANVAKHSATNQLNSYRTIEENRFLYVIRNRTLVFSLSGFLYDFSTLSRY